jgi:D-alanyl-D-alanine carboxypeptidase/D-alanyl-D-alanine-endopeptidase (penicillin-binding protein 4)
VQKINNAKNGDVMRLVNIIIALGIVILCNQAAFAWQRHHHYRPVIQTVARNTTTNLPILYGTLQLANELNHILDLNRTGANVAIYVRSMQYGDILYSRNINHPFTPASTMKVLTAEAALIYLGPNYRFSTQLLTNAKSVKNGVLQGDLYIVLSGDPSLTYADLANLLLTLKSQQIQTIAGNVYIDSTAYDKSFYGPGWQWKDETYCYGAPISAGIINHNCLSFQVAPSRRTGQNAQIYTSPNYFYPMIRNTVITKAARSRACYLHLSADPNDMIDIDGCMGKGQDVSGVTYVVSNVPDYDRELFKSLLSRLGINVAGTVTFGSAPQNLAMMGQHASQPLFILITEMLKKSDNVFAGALFKKMGELYTHQPGSWANGSIAVSQILSRRAGVNVAGLRILDGSGLSMENAVTPIQLMQALQYAYHNGAISNDFIMALPIAGVDGTLKHRMWNIAGRVHAKTGTMSESGVSALAGYTVGANKEPLAFVIMINGSTGYGWRYRGLEDQVVTALTKYQRT